jgi:hypothetical protein
MSALAASPALAPGKAAPYVIAAYAVFLAIVLIYVGIMARRLTKTERDLAELTREVEGSAPLGGGGKLESRTSSEADGRDLEPVP